MMPKLFRFSNRRLSGLVVLALLALGAPPQANAGPYAGFVSEVESDRVLYAQNADELRHPASLTKMMTLYLLFEALARGQLSLESPMVASAFAVSKPPSRLGLKPGDTLTVEQGILGLVTQSANDAATVIAETLGGSEANFAQMMTQKAQQLGMTRTVFRNAQGLPDPEQWTTARDMYALAKALLKHYPQYYAYFSTESFWFRDRSFRNHNHLLNKCPGVDGIKTGFINSSGFNLVASAKRNDVRLVGVVFGGPTHSRRDAHMQEILDDGFAQLEGHEPTVHLASFDNTAPKPLAHKVADVVNELPVPTRKLHYAAKLAKAHRAVAESHQRREVSARRYAHPPTLVKVAMREAEEGHSGKYAKAHSAIPHHNAQPASAYTPVTHGKNHGKPVSKR